MHPRALLPSLAALALAVAAPAALAAQEIGLAVGSRGPAAALQTLDGRPTDLARYVGRTPVLIQFWATWCSSCKALEPQLTRIARTYGPRVRLLGVAVGVNQTPQRARLYAEKHKLPVEVLWDGEGKAAEAYDAPATSYVVVLDAAGKVVYTGQGPDQDLERAVRLAMR